MPRITDSKMVDLSWLGGDKAQMLIAGALGGVVRWLTLRDHWSDGIISVVVGAICSVYLSPLVTPGLVPMFGAINIARDSTNSLSGFIIGIGGITLSGMVMDLWRARRRQAKAEADIKDARAVDK